jgi:hypothetical protein
MKERGAIRAKEEKRREEKRREEKRKEKRKASKTVSFRLGLPFEGGGDIGWAVVRHMKRSLSK